MLLARAKVERRDPEVVERELLATLARLEERLATDGPDDAGQASPYLQRWFAPQALGELLAYRAVAGSVDGAAADLQRVVLSRAARSARLTPHYDLDFPKQPQHGPYWCHKHRRECRPVEEAARFLRRYTLDTAKRVRAFQDVRRPVDVTVHHADARALEWGVTFDASDHVAALPRAHRLPRAAPLRVRAARARSVERAEIGAPALGLSRAAFAAYVDDMVAVFARARAHLRPGAPVIVVVDDPRGPVSVRSSSGPGLELTERRLRHVNRRTGRRGGEFFEQVLLARA